MSKFNKIEAIKEDFDDNLYQNDLFKHTKQLFRNFKNYFNENKAFLTGLVGAVSVSVMLQNAMINQYFPEKEIIKNTIGQSELSYTSLNELTKTPSLEDISKSFTVDDVSKPKDDYEMMSKQYLEKVFEQNEIKRTKNYLEDVKVAHQIRNIKHTDHVRELNDDGVRDALKLTSDQMIVFKNPFWENNTIEIYGAKEKQGSMYQPVNTEHSHQYTISNALYLIDNSPNEIRLAKEQRLEGQTDQDLFDWYKYIIYHEAAHASLKQSLNYDPATSMYNRTIDRETHADLAGITLLAVENGTLPYFNKVVDNLIKSRLEGLEYNDYAHNTAYALVELKRTINENPSLLKMKRSDVIEFASVISNQISTSLMNPQDYGVEFTPTRDGIKHDIENKKNGMLIKSLISEVEDSAFVEPVTQHSRSAKELNDLADNIVNLSSTGVRYDQITASIYDETLNKMLNEKNYGAVYGTQSYIDVVFNEMKKEVNKNPIITHDVIVGASNKVFMDEVNYDYSKVLKIKDELVDKKSTSNTSSIFKNKKGT